MEESNQSKRVEYSRINATSEFLSKKIEHIIPDKYAYSKAIEKNDLKQIESNEKYMELQKELKEVQEQSHKLVTRRAEIIHEIDDIKKSVTLNDEALEKQNTFIKRIDAAEKEKEKLLKKFQEEVLFAKTVDDLQAAYDSCYNAILKLAFPLRQEYEAIKEK